MIKVSERFEPHLVKLAFLFIIIGFGTKACLAPMHTWLPDAHSQAHSPISAMFSGVLLNCSLYGIMRFHIITSRCVGDDYSSTLLMTFGLISVLVSIPFILVQRDCKRLLAFSSIEHIGFITLGFGFGGIYSIYGAELHVLNHAVVKSLLFFCAGNIFLKYKTVEIERIMGVIKTLPVTGIVFIIGIFAITGTPPFNIFVSEFIVLSDSFSSGNVLIIIFSVLLVLSMALIFVGFISNMFKMLFGSPAETIATGEISRFTIGAMIFLCFFVLIISFYVPPIMRDMLHDISNIIRHV